MRFGVAASLILLFASSISAAPTTSFSFHSSVASSLLSSSHPSRRSSLFFPTHTHRHSLSLTIGSPSSPTEFPETPRTIHTHKVDRQSAQRNAAIVLGGVAATILLVCLFAIFRCMFNYKRPPKRDRIAEVLQRHNLQCEMEELERNPYALRRPSLREPAPPYFPRPPSYAESPHRDGFFSPGTERSQDDSTSSSTRNLLPISPHTPFPDYHTSASPT